MFAGLQDNSKAVALVGAGLDQKHLAADSLPFPVLTVATPQRLRELPQTHFDAVAIGLGSHHATQMDALLSDAFRILKPGGSLRVFVGADAGQAAQCHKALLFAGFVDAAPLPSQSGVVVAQRPPWEMGAAVPIGALRKKPRTAPNGNGNVNGNINGNGTATAAPAVNARQNGSVMLDTNDLAEEDLVADDLDDEDALLDHEDPLPQAQLPECGPNSLKRKACKNCSCGFSEQLASDSKSSSSEDAAASTTTVEVKPVSACGNCYLGDAFRCASCPYLGKPAFRPGDTVKLQL